MASMGNIKIEIEEALVNDNKTLREALSNLLDVFERCEAGFPPDVELRFLARDLAKAALTHNVKLRGSPRFSASPARMPLERTAHKP